MTVSENIVHFSDLARYALALVATVRERVCRFIKGFHPSIKISMVRELEMDISYQQVVSIARRLEAAVCHGRGYGSRHDHSALLGVSGILVPSRPQEPYYVPPVSSVPLTRGAFSGQSSRPGPIQSQQPRSLRACFKYGDTLHMVRDCPILRRGAPPQTSQPPRAPPGRQAMIPASTTATPAQPTRGKGRGGRGRPRGGGQARYHALQARTEAVSSDSVITGYYRRFVERFSSIASPMTRLTHKGSPFRWIEECEESFQKLKTTLTTTLVLGHGDAKEVTIGDDGALRTQGRLCVPNVDGLREVRASAVRWVASEVRVSKVEMGEDHYGFHCWASTDPAEA
ncbi:uncharacterized protein [Nicotiana tomentosiformis]|uniref:uncharacterized protein n=1 Tax=Nicotiana tomentosiformis TaxID=4098 RepID=UPI00388CB28F